MHNTSLTIRQNGLVSKPHNCNNSRGSLLPCFPTWFPTLFSLSTVFFLFFFYICAVFIPCYAMLTFVFVFFIFVCFCNMFACMFSQKTIPRPFSFAWCFFCFASFIGCIFHLFYCLLIFAEQVFCR